MQKIGLYCVCNLVLAKATVCLKCRLIKQMHEIAYLSTMGAKLEISFSRGAASGEPNYLTLPAKILPADKPPF